MHLVLHLRTIVHQHLEKVEMDQVEEIAKMLMVTLFQVMTK